MLHFPNQWTKTGSITGTFFNDLNKLKLYLIGSPRGYIFQINELEVGSIKDIFHDEGTKTVINMRFFVETLILFRSKQ